MQQPVGGEDNSYPKGTRLRTSEFEASKQHTPRDAVSGKPLCWKFSSNAGCGTRGTECQFGVHKFLKQNGIHWTVRAQIARLGGFKGTPVLNSGEIDGFIQSLREAHLIEVEKKKKDNPAQINPTGGYCNENPETPLEDVTLFPPPGLADAHNHEPDQVTDQFDMQTTLPNEWMGQLPDDIGTFDYTLTEDDLRRVLYGDDNWVGITPVPAISLDNILEQRTLNKQMAPEASPYLEHVDSTIHCALINWANHSGNPEGLTVQELVLKGLGNIILHGNAKARTYASEAFVAIQGTSSHITDENGACRIYWGNATQLDDCRSQSVAIGTLSFGAIDFGDTIPLSEMMQKNLNNEDRSERNQCTLISLAAGLANLARGQERFLPSASRVLQMAGELRQIEWHSAQEYASSPGKGFSNNEKMVHSLCHDVLSPNHDRDYRSLSLLLSGYFREQNVIIRVFDIPKSLCGETALHINVFGDMNSTGPTFVNVMAYAGHMRWLRNTGETTAAVERDWLSVLGDFVTVFPWLSIDSVVDRDRSDVNRAPFIARRQCNRKEKAPLAPTSFYQSTKLTDLWRKTLVVEGKRTGGYPELDPLVYGEINPVFPITDKEWRGSVPISPETMTFVRNTRKEFTLSGLVSTANDGNLLIKTAGPLQSACRSFQEFFMQQQAHLVDNANLHLHNNPELCSDLAEIHRLGAIPKYRGPTPPVDRVLGLPHNPSDARLMMTKLWSYVSEWKMLVSTQEGLPADTRFLCPPSTTASKKLPERTPPTDKRLIWDGRKINIHCPKQGYWFMETPMVKGLAEWYVQTKTNFHGIPIVGTKRDVDSAFTRCRIRPDAASLFSTEFSAKDDGVETRVIFFYTVLPFGFTGPPGISGRVMQGVKWMHSQFAPLNPLWDGAHPFRCEIFVEDGMFIEASIGDRAEQNVKNWEWAARQLLGDTAVSKKKLDLEGHWGQELILFGFHVNLIRDEIALPYPKIVGAWNLVRQEVFNPGNYTTPSRRCRSSVVVSTIGVTLTGCGGGWLNRLINSYGKLTQGFSGPDAATLRNGWLFGM